MKTFNFLLLASLLYFIVKYVRSKNSPILIKPELDITRQEDPLVRQSQKWLQNKFIGHQKTPEHSYNWDDVNIQCGIGDTTIDLSYTVLPRGEAIIFVRNIIGNIEILVPYDVELTVQHSVMTGATSILEHEEKTLFNQTTRFQTANYQTASQKVKIITSIVVGSLEVKRI
jgi:lia operon protein LiaF